jgi:5'-3' exonuclease
MVQNKATRHLYEALLIDVSNLYHASYEAGRSMTTRLPNGASLFSGGIVLFLKSVAKACREYLVPMGTVFYLCDATYAGSHEVDDAPLSRRRRIDPSYKENRAVQSPNFYRGLEVVLSILGSYRDRSFLVRIPGYEADDLVPPILDRYAPSPARALLMSTDEDWCRSMSERIDVLARNKVSTIADFQEKRGYSPLGEAVKIYKSFRGDSDGISPGVPGIREKDLLRLIEEFSSLDALKHNLSSVAYLTDDWKEKIVSGWPRILLNYHLVDFLPVSDVDLQEGTSPGFFRPRALRAMYDALGLDAASVDERVAGRDYARVDPTVPDAATGFFIKKKIRRI